MEMVWRRTIAVALCVRKSSVGFAKKKELARKTLQRRNCKEEIERRNSVHKSWGDLIRKKRLKEAIGERWA